MGADQYSADERARSLKERGTELTLRLAELRSHTRASTVDVQGAEQAAEAALQANWEAHIRAAAALRMAAAAHRKAAGHAERLGNHHLVAGHQAAAKTKEEAAEAHEMAAEVEARIRQG